MCRKLLINFAKLKLEHHIMQVRKYGKISLIIKNQIFGHLDALSTKLLLYILLFQVKIQRLFTSKLLKKRILRCLYFILISSIKFLKGCLKKSPKRESLLVKILFSLDYILKNVEKIVPEIFRSLAIVQKIKV